MKHKELYIIFYQNRDVVERIKGESFCSIDELKKKIAEIDKEWYSEDCSTFNAFSLEDFIVKMNNQEIDKTVSEVFISYVFIKSSNSIPLPNGSYKYLYMDCIKEGVGKLYSADHYNLNEVYNQKVLERRLHDGRQQGDSTIVYSDAVFLLFHTRAEVYDYVFKYRKDKKKG